MRYALSKKIILETGLIRCSRVSETMSINELVAELAELKKKDSNVKIKKKVVKKTEENVPKENSLEQWYKRPSIEKIVKTFDGKIADIEG